MNKHQLSRRQLDWPFAGTPRSGAVQRPLGLPDQPARASMLAFLDFRFLSLRLARNLQVDYRPEDRLELFQIPLDLDQ
jgi:hypothetical protein